MGALFLTPVGQLWLNTGTVMTNSASNPTSRLKDPVTRVTGVHFFFAAAYIVSIISFDSWNLIPPDALSARWTFATILLVVTALVWYVLRSGQRRAWVYMASAYMLIVVDIALAAFSVYSERGMASRGVALFAIPIITSAVLMTRAALFTTATLSAAAYSWAAVRYFAQNPSEGYKIELYGILAFYVAGFYIMAALLWAVVRPAKA
jgi:hypothetical protein